MKSVAFGSIGALVLAAAAAIVFSVHPDPTLIDAALVGLVPAVWSLAWLSREGPARDAGFILVPLMLVVELAIAGESLRTMLFGAILACAAVSYLWRASDEWSTGEILASLAVVGPLRIVGLEPVPVLMQAVFVAGAIALWRSMRRTSSIELVAAAVLLLSVSIPSAPAHLSLVPWCLAALVWVLGRDSLVARIVVVGIAVFIAKWLAAAIAVVLLVDTVRPSRGGQVAASPWFVPGFTAAIGNLRSVVPTVAFFPAVASRFESLLPVAGTAVLAMTVRPSLAAPIISVGIVVACTRVNETSESAALELPSLVLGAVILLFFPWSGAVAARPPALLSTAPLLVLAAIALLPPTLRSLTGVAAILLFAAVSVQPTNSLENGLKIGRSLSAGESVSIRIEDGSDRIEVGLAGANLAAARPGDPVATIEVLDAAGRGYARRVEIGEVADWGAFRPSILLSTWNPRPDRPGPVEGYGIESWVRGTGRIAIEGVVEPRWVVVTADPALDSEQRVVVEEIRFR